MSVSDREQEFELDEVQRGLFERIEKSNDNFFIQGQAGTGKSTFVRYLKEHLNKQIIVVCPTAVAALQIGGATMHSTFQIPPKDFIILDNLELKKKPASLLKKADLLIIDEISMVRPDILDTVDYLAKEARRSYEPFGGLQLLVIGDLCQLPPVIPDSVYNVFEREYGHKNAYFFDARSYKAADFKFVEFAKVYRQEDSELLDKLVQIRQNRDVMDAIGFFNGAKIADADVLKNAVTITPRRNTADSINQNRLSALQTPSKSYEGEASGKFEEKDFPSPGVLTLKVGALVMFNKNNHPMWVNGASGVVEELLDDTIRVRLVGKNIVVTVRREEWQRFEYKHDRAEDKIVENEIGSFKQFPLQLGYALTIHKAQGKTLDKVVVDLAGAGAFVHGQMYVALSRTRKFEDMHVKENIATRDVIFDERVVEFLRRAG